MRRMKGKVIVNKRNIRKCKTNWKLILLSIVLIILVTSIVFFVNGDATANNEVEAVPTATVVPTPNSTPIPTPIVKVKVKYKKDKLLQDHTVYHASEYNRNINLRTAAEKINGTKVMPNEGFSFYGVIGKPTEEAGFVYAGSIINHKSVDSVGGGICENAISLNTVIENAGITTYGKKGHSQDVGYVNETDHEITVFYGQWDFTFTNTLTYPILIKQGAIGGNVRTRLYKMKKIYVVTIKDPVSKKKTVKKYSKKNMPEEYKQFIPEY